MIVPSSVFGLEKLTDSASSRYALGGVLFERDRKGMPLAVATDGKIAAVLTWDENKEHPSYKPPKAEFTAIVPAEACQEAKRFKFKGKGAVPGVALDEHATDGTVPLSATDLICTKQTAPRAIEGR